MPGYHIGNLGQEGINEKHLCCHCGLLLRDPVQTSCGHLYCQSCLGNVFQNGMSLGKCVSDQCILLPGEVFPDNFARREILALVVHCPFMDDGCKWKGKVHHLEYHVSNCDFLKVLCVFPKCSVLVKKVDLGYHLQQECVEASRFPQNFDLPRTGVSPEGREPCSEISFAGLIEEMKKAQERINRLLKHDPWCVDDEDDSSIEVTRRLTSLENRMEEREALAQERFENLAQTVRRLIESFENVEEQLTENEFFRDEQRMEIDLLCQDFRRLRDCCRDVQIRGGQQSAVSGAGNEMGRRLSSHDGIAERQALLQENLERLTQTVNDGLRDDGRIRIDFLCEAFRRLQGCFTNMENAGGQPSSEVPGRLAILENGRDNPSPQLVTLQRQLETAQETIRRQERRLESIEHTLALRDIALAQLELDNIIQQEASCYDGLLLWKVSDFEGKLNDAVTGRLTAFYSPPFYTSRHGYKMCARLYLNGDGMGKGTHISLFFVVMRGQYDALLRWPFRQKVTMMLLDQDNVEHVIDAFRPDPNSSSFQRPRREMNVASGCPLFCPLAELSNHAYVRDDTMFFKIIVDTSDLGDEPHM